MWEFVLRLPLSFVTRVEIENGRRVVEVVYDRMRVLVEVVADWR